MFQFQSIIAYFKKHFSVKDVLFLGLVLIFFFATRLISLDQFPIFSDEGIYIRWAKVAWHDSTWRFISLTDGRQPLQTWATIPFLKMFPTNALLAGRLFSVASGFAALVGFFALSFYLFNKKTAYVATLLYLATPYYLFYDRIALVDSTVNAAFIWILFFSILLIRTVRLDVALLFGLIVGMALLAKSSVRMFVGLSALAPILLWQKNIRKFITHAINYYILFGIGLVLALSIYNVQRLSPFFHYIAQKNTTFVMTFSEFLTTPFAIFPSNIKTIPIFLFWEMGWVIAFLGLYGFYRLFKKERLLALYLASWFMLSYIALAFFSKVIFPRYLIFFSTLLVLCASYGLSHLNKGALKKIWIFAIIFVAFFYHYTMLFDYKNISFPPTDRGQYIESQTAVWGAQQILEVAREKAKSKKVLLVAEGDFGLIADVLDVFLLPTDTNIGIKGYWPIVEKHIVDYRAEQKAGTHIYFVFSHRSEFPDHWPIHLVKKLMKPGNRAAVYMFEYDEK